MADKTLLEKAKAVRIVKSRGNSRDIPLDDRVELGMAWMKGEVTATQVSSATGKNDTSFYSLVAIGLREAYRRGLIKNGDSTNS